jgi:hypothetical protein
MQDPGKDWKGRIKKRQRELLPGKVEGFAVDCISLVVEQ